MNFNAGIIDQQLTGLMEQFADQLPDGDAHKKRAAAFVVLCMAHHLDISRADALELLTEGGNDAGVDGLHLGEVEDGEFTVTLFQGKYKWKNLDGDAHFPENGVQKAVGTLHVLFNPFRSVTLNEAIKPRVEEIRSLIRDGMIPKVHWVLCNNGVRWHPNADPWITEAEQMYPDKVSFTHFNHDSVVRLLQRTQAVDATLQMTGQLIVEDMNYVRVLIGRVAVHQIAALFEAHGDRLLQRNIRRYLGLHGNRVNAAIRATLCSDQADKFYFYNNGITVVCDKFDYNAFQKEDHQVRLKNLQIINGGQTVQTIHQVQAEMAPDAVNPAASVMVRVYQPADEDTRFVQDITDATNSQNPVDLRDLRSNDPLQKQLEIGMQGLGYVYKRQREDGANGAKVITSARTAEAVLAVWREKPQQARFQRKEHFGKLYAEIFTGLNAAQALLAVLIFREVEHERKHPRAEAVPLFLPYASYYLSMVIGRALLKAQGVALADVSHHNVAGLIAAFQNGVAAFHADAVARISAALRVCYGNRFISLQQLSATFRRGDLLEMLDTTDGPR